MEQLREQMSISDDAEEAGSSSYCYWRFVAPCVSFRRLFRTSSWSSSERFESKFRTSSSAVPPISPLNSLLFSLFSKGVRGNAVPPVGVFFASAPRGRVLQNPAKRNVSYSWMRALRSGAGPNLQRSRWTHPQCSRHRGRCNASRRRRALGE